MLGCSSHCAASSPWCSHGLVAPTALHVCRTPGAVSEVLQTPPVLVVRWQALQTPISANCEMERPSNRRPSCSRVTTAVGKHQRAELPQEPNIHRRFPLSPSTTRHEQSCKQQRVPVCFMHPAFPAQSPPWGTAAAQPQQHSGWSA